ncbi:Inosine/uridine-preferring nucleoside hydrolase [Scheffersomyces amazonensis]|uniref:Inosine/uridine-preferring nucleoside hydrolase n=1 Tax=Scheffersomyces amazonensis TaxID=1078765 RepID=UPI00315D54BD
MVSLKLSTLAIALLSSVANAKKVFIDNDGITPPNILFPLMAGWDIVGVSTSFGSSSNVDSAGTAYDTLQQYNLSSCIPHYLGAQGPLLRTQDTFNIWQDLFGELVWQGAFAPGYENEYSWSNITYNETLPGAVALINAVQQYKDTDPVVIYAAGMMTTVAQALSLYPDLPKDAGGLYIMGGYFDTQYTAGTGTPIVNDINTDINLIQDPEAAQMVLTANWSSIVIGSNVTNYLVPSQELYDQIIDRAGGLDVIQNNTYLSPLLDILYTGNFTENEIESDDQDTLPFWDQVVSAYLAFPELVTSTTNFSVAVDTQFYSPFYGALRIWGAQFAPTGQITGNATVVNTIDDGAFYNYLIQAYFLDWRQYCEVGGPVQLEGFA